MLPPRPQRTIKILPWYFQDVRKGLFSERGSWFGFSERSPEGGEMTDLGSELRRGPRSGLSEFEKLAMAACLARGPLGVLFASLYTS